MEKFFLLGEVTMKKILMMLSVVLAVPALTMCSDCDNGDGSSGEGEGEGEG